MAKKSKLGSIAANDRSIIAVELARYGDNMSPAQAMRLLNLGFARMECFLLAAHAIAEHPAFDLLVLESPELGGQVNWILTRSKPSAENRQRLKTQILAYLRSFREDIASIKSMGVRMSKFIYRFLLAYEVEYVQKYGDDSELTYASQQLRRACMSAKDGPTQKQIDAGIKEAARKEKFVLEEMLLDSYEDLYVDG